VTPEIAARLAALDIALISEARRYAIFARGNCVALVERNEAGFASLGSSGMMTENGLAYLVWRDGCPLLVAKGVEQPAEAQQVDNIRRFSTDLKSALALD